MPLYCFSLFWLGLSLGATMVLAANLHLDLLVSWFVSITLATWLVFGFDKAISGSKWTRVPETVLLVLTFAGGTLGAIIGRSMFRHKTVKPSFRRKFWLTVLAQLALIGVGVFMQVRLGA